MKYQYSLITCQVLNDSEDGRSWERLLVQKLKCHRQCHHRTNAETSMLALRGANDQEDIYQRSIRLSSFLSSATDTTPESVKGFSTITGTFSLPPSLPGSTSSPSWCMIAGGKSVTARSSERVMLVLHQVCILKEMKYCRREDQLFAPIRPLSLYRWPASKESTWGSCVLIANLTVRRFSVI